MLVVALAFLALVITQSSLLTNQSPSSNASWNVLNNPIDSSQTLQWADYSYWDQPWRSYQETPPANQLLNAVGINFNVNGADADATAHLLADSGVKRARIEVGWDSIDYTTGQIRASSQTSIDEKFTALKKYGIRPLLLLNANSGGPTPNIGVNLNLVAAAPVGATTVQLDAASAALVTPGYTGFTDGLDYPSMAKDLILSVDANHVAHLSQPLSKVLAAGKQTAHTLKYLPFYPSTNPDGSANATFTATMNGWLSYVGVMSHYMSSVFGPTGFDVEVWNELSFGSQFLNAYDYYDSAHAPAGSNKKDPDNKIILTDTINYLRDPAHGVPKVGIGDGFSNQSPWASGADTPAGLTAIDKHYYSGFKTFPQQGPLENLTPINALGQKDGVHQKGPGNGSWVGNFTPTFDAFFPEFYLSGLMTETLTRDLSPIDTSVYGTPHGRDTHQPGSAPPQVWMTEDNMGPDSGPQGQNAQPGSAADRHIMAKDALRYLSSFVNKGVTAFDFYAVTGDGLNLVDDGFLSDLKSNPTAYPGDAAGGSTMAALNSFTSAFGGGKISSTRALSLTQIAQEGNHAQFAGDGTAAHPPLYDRDVLGFFPFQVTNSKFVVPVYVMTRNVEQVYNTSLPVTDPARYDMPPETFRLTIDGVDSANAQVSFTDPLTGRSQPATIVSRSGSQIVVQLDATDSVRLLTITDSSQSTPTPTPTPSPTPSQTPTPTPTPTPTSTPPPVPTRTPVAAGSNPNYIVKGSDGNLWFTEQGSSKIGRLAPSGQLTEYATPTPNAVPTGIAAGPDGAVWFAEYGANKIGRISMDGKITEYSQGIPMSAEPRGITVGPDGALWFTQWNTAEIGRITTSGKITEFPVKTKNNWGITTGSDGALWFAESDSAKIGRITTSGKLTQFAATSNPREVALGPDGAIWFGDRVQHVISRISTTGAVTSYPVSGTVDGITSNHGKLWFVEESGNRIAEATTGGQVTELSPFPNASAVPVSIIAGPNNSFWYTEYQGDAVDSLPIP